MPLRARLRNRRRPLALLLALAALALASSAPARAETVLQPARPGRFMANVRVGPSFGLRSSGHQLAVGLDLGVAVTPDRLGYVLVPVQAQLLGGATDVLVPLGFQYDVPIPTLKGLFVYPRVSAGYVYSTRDGATHAALVLPELGIKYVFAGRFNLGLEPFSLPIIFGGDGPTRVHYRTLLLLGFNF